MARLFPLPNLVLFPSTAQRLHIFEPRYRQMTADALADDYLITMAVLQPGWEADYLGRPPIFPVACLGQIVDGERLEDGRYNLLLRGRSRVRIVEEVDSGKLYRTARVELLPDVPVAAPEQEQELRRRLAQQVPAWCVGRDPQIEQALVELVRSTLPFGIVCDLLAFSLGLAAEVKLPLLQTPDVAQRGQLLLDALAVPLPQPTDPEARKYPPDFSAN
jgi:Lon protease-like protein